MRFVSCSLSPHCAPAGWPTNKSTTRTSTSTSTTSTGEQRLWRRTDREVRPGGRDSGSRRGLRPSGQAALCARSPGFAGAGESGGSAAPQPGADDRTRRPPGRARRGSTGGCTDGNLRGSVGVTLGALSKSFKMKLKTRGCPGKGFFFFFKILPVMLNC